MPAQMYRQQPACYMYNSITRRHMLKGSPAFKQAFKKNPDAFVETIEMFPMALSDIAALSEQKREPAPAPVVAKSEPGPAPGFEQKPTNDMIARVRALVNEEVHNNPAKYENKTTADLDSMFRAMLIERLSKPPSSTTPIINKSTTPTKPAPKPAPKKGEAKLKFKMRKAPSSDEEEDNISGLSESEED